MFRVSSHLSSLNIKTPSQTSPKVWLLGDSTSCQVGHLCLVSSVFTLIGGLVQAGVFVISPASKAFWGTSSVYRVHLYC